MRGTVWEPVWVWDGKRLDEQRRLWVRRPNASGLTTSNSSVCAVGAIARGGFCCVQRTLRASACWFDHVL